MSDELTGNIRFETPLGEWKRCPVVHPATGYQCESAADHPSRHCITVLIRWSEDRSEVGVSQI